MSRFLPDKAADLASNVVSELVKVKGFYYMEKCGYDLMMLLKN